MMKYTKKTPYQCQGFGENAMVFYNSTGNMMNIRTIMSNKPTNQNGWDWILIAILQSDGLGVANHTSTLCWWLNKSNINECNTIIFWAGRITCGAVWHRSCQALFYQQTRQHR